MVRPLKALKLWWKWRHHSKLCDVNPEDLTWRKGMKVGEIGVVCKDCYHRIVYPKPKTGLFLNSLVVRRK